MFIFIFQYVVCAEKDGVVIKYGVYSKEKINFFEVDFFYVIILLLLFVKSRS